MTKALVLFSGGLDSRLVVKILQEQGLDVELIHFKLPFGCGCCSSFECNFNFSQKEQVKLTTMDCTTGKLFEEYLNIIRKPKFGRGVGMNSCIDCKIFMFKKACEYAKKNKIQIIATGEVLGERPMSQTSRALKIIDTEMGTDFELLRPLSAKLLPETKAEKQKLVDREKFFDISGRGRKTQFELAKRFKITFPTPAGGCLLCEKEYAARLKDLFQYSKNISPELLATLANFRHFRSPESKAKIILGKNEQENLLLEKLNKKLKWNILEAEENNPGPTALFENKEDKSLIGEIIKAYSKNSSLENRKKFDDIRIKAEN